MEFVFVCFILADSSSVLLSSLLGASATDGNWDDVVVTAVGRPATLTCVDGAARGAVTVNWKMKSPGDSKWKLVLSANERKEFSGGASKASMRLTDSNFQDTGNFSLFFLPERVDGGLYSCLIKRQERKVRERIILLAVLTVTIVPRPPVLQNSILRLVADVSPGFAYTRITWAAPGGRPMRSETMRNTGVVAKRPQFQPADGGAYTCMVHPNGNSSSTLFAFNVDVTVDTAKVASFRNITHGPQISTASLAGSSFSLSCPTVKGDYVRLYWQPPDNRRQKDMKLAYLYDRWRDEADKGAGQQQLELAGPPYKHQDGSFGFHLRPQVTNGGLYICEVFLNDNVFSQATRLSVLKVEAIRSPSHLELWCQYSERSQVERAGWRHHNLSRRLHVSSHSPGLITTSLALPIGPDAAGNYTCTLQLRNRQTIWAVHTVAAAAAPLAPEGGTNVSAGATVPSLLPSLSALLLLVPLVAAAVGVLLWRQGHISRRDIEQSLSHYSGEVENIYENPEDIRQTSPQASIYMDLKPRGEDDVYKELDR